MIKSWRVALDEKWELVASLAKVQGKIEEFEGNISVVLGKQKTAAYRNDYLFRGCFADELTIMGEYEKEVSQISCKPLSWSYDQKEYKLVTFIWRFLYSCTYDITCCKLRNMY